MNCYIGVAVSTNRCVELIWHGSYVAAWDHHLINRDSLRLFREKTRCGGCMYSAPAYEVQLEAVTAALVRTMSSGMLRRVGW
jgi:hypothetical protein